MVSSDKKIVLTKADGKQLVTRLDDGDVRLTLQLTGQAYDHLVLLKETGLFGRDVFEVAERLVCRSLIDLAEDSWLPQPGDEDDDDDDDD